MEHPPDYQPGPARRAGPTEQALLRARDHRANPHPGTGPAHFSMRYINKQQAQEITMHQYHLQHGNQQALLRARALHGPLPALERA